VAANRRNGPVVSDSSGFERKLVRWCRIRPVVSDWYVGFSVGFSEWWRSSRGGSCRRPDATDLMGLQPNGALTRFRPDWCRRSGSSNLSPCADETMKWGPEWNRRSGSRSSGARFGMVSSIMHVRGSSITCANPRIGVPLSSRISLILRSARR
jgi:hypothetical protein